MNRKFLFSILLLVSIFLAGCAPAVAAQPEDLAAREIRVVTTIGMIADITQQVGGERVEVKGLMGPGVDPHLYKARESDVNKLENADVVFYNGLHLEAQMTRILEQMDRLGALAVPVSRTIDLDVLFTPPQFGGNYDPHIWFDVQLWMKAVEVVRDTLAEMDPGSAALYRANAERYLDELAALDVYAREQIASIPPERRVLITAHDAFNYFSRAYGIEVLGLQGISTESEASTADVQGLADTIASRRIPAIFVESSVPRRNVEAVQAAVKAQGFDVVIGGQLFSDAMGNPDTPEGTYIGMVRHNVDTIVAALTK